MNNIKYYRFVTNGNNTTGYVYNRSKANSRNMSYKSSFMSKLRDKFSNILGDPNAYSPRLKDPKSRYPRLNSQVHIIPYKFDKNQHALSEH